MYEGMYDQNMINRLLQKPLIYPSSALLPRASSVKEVSETPMTMLNSEQVFLNPEDDTILYIKRVDSAGHTTVKRYRCYEDAEPTQQEINNSRYVTIEEFNKLKSDILSSINSNKYYGKGKPNGNKPTNENV